MVDVKPFNAVIYNKNLVNLRDVIAPPYDVIDENYREKLSLRSPYNIVELILPQGDDKYEKAAKAFNSWLEEKVLQRLEKPCIIYLIQEYTTENNKPIKRKGFIATNKLEEFSAGNIMPHEYTMSGPKEDRLNLTKACKANFSQIFMVYSDAEQLIEKAVDVKNRVPYAEVVDDLDVKNTVYIIDDAITLNTITEVMKDKKLLIADGHHRYETALNYSKINKEAQYVMSYFTNLNDENLVIYPTHRIIEKMIEPFVVIDRIQKYFDMDIIDFNSQNKFEKKAEFLEKLEIENQKQITFGLYMKNVNKFYVLKLAKNVDDLIDAPDVLKKLDLTVLHEVLLKKEFGYTQEELMAQAGIKYIKQEQEAFDRIDMGKAQYSFIMPYPKMKDVLAISEAGYRMPQKSTYFYPKLLSGIAINKLD